MPTGKLNLGNLWLSIPGQAEPQKINSLSSGKKLIIILLEPDKEASRHVLDELESYSDHFSKWQGSFILAIPHNKRIQIHTLDSYAFQQKHIRGVDLQDNMLRAIEATYGTGLAERMPLVVFCDEKGYVYLFSAGYKIGIGEQLLKLTR